MQKSKLQAAKDALAKLKPAERKNVLRMIVQARGMKRAATSSKATPSKT